MVPPCFAGLPALSNLPANHGLGDDYAALDAFTVRLGSEFLRCATPAVLSRGRRPCRARQRILVSVSAKSCDVKGSIAGSLGDGVFG